MEDLTGRQFGPYQIVSPLGEGGMAAVYRAYQPAMERYVAVKVLPRRFADDPQFSARFTREAKLLAQLQHPHILPVFDYGQAEGFTYLVMPLVRSGTLADLLLGQPLPLQRIRQVITQLGDALHYAHARGLIHRDVKPSNVLIDESGNCLLTDFGLARMAESSVQLTTTGTIMGTPAYMSPEQGAGQKIDSRSDIYSLGIILYEMATGRVPYRAETPAAVIFKHIYDPLPAARDLNPELAEAVELVILKALSKSPEGRYPTAKDLVQAVHYAIPDSWPVDREGRTATRGIKGGQSRTRQRQDMAVRSGTALHKTGRVRRPSARSIAAITALIGVAGVLLLATAIRTRGASQPTDETAEAVAALPAAEALSVGGPASAGSPGPSDKDPTLYDDFNDPVFDGSLDPSLWSTSVEEPGYVQQEEGVLVVSVAPQGQSTATARATLTLTAGQPGFVESRLLLSGVRKLGQRGDVSVSMAASIKGGRALVFSCLIYRRVPVAVGCEVYGEGAEPGYTSRMVVTTYDVWHLVRMEMGVGGDVTFSVDGDVVGWYRPGDAEALEGAILTPRLEAWSPERDGITAHFDDVRIGPVR